MKILVACEESQAVCIAFRAAGHESYSADILPCSGGHPEWHIQGDIYKVIYNKWDMVIGFPPCTRLTNSVLWYIHKRKLYDEVKQAASFFNDILNCGAPLICIENPVQHGIARQHIIKYDQVIQPYNFNENASKATCLWLKGLPKLKNTGFFPPRLVGNKKRWDNQTDGGWNKLPPDKKGEEGLRAKLRSKTFPGIAQAMADQWGNINQIKSTLF